jgi:hypothetical protein
LKEVFGLRENIAFALTELMIAESVGETEDIWRMVAKVCLYPDLKPEDNLVSHGHTERVVYYENSALNVVMSSCIASHIRTCIAGATGAAFYGAALKGALINFMKPGGGLDWQDVVRAASGRDIEPEAIGAELNRKLSQESK